MTLRDLPFLFWSARRLNIRQFLKDTIILNFETQNVYVVMVEAGYQLRACQNMQLTEAMKYNRLLFISIAVGILFSACATNQPNPKTEEKTSVRAPSSKRIATATSGLTGPLPNYVKHNQWDFLPPWPTQKPYINVGTSSQQPGMHSVRDLG